jgi:hypothetical protein
MRGIRYKCPPPLASIRVASEIGKGALASIGPNVIRPLFARRFGASRCNIFNISLLR